MKRMPGESIPWTSGPKAAEPDARFAYQKSAVKSSHGLAVGRALCARQLTKSEAAEAITYKITGSEPIRIDGFEPAAAESSGTGCDPRGRWPGGG